MPNETVREEVEKRARAWMFSQDIEIGLVTPTELSRMAEFALSERQKVWELAAQEMDRRELPHAAETFRAKAAEELGEEKRDGN